ncbi:hypothetical protein CLOM_g12646 [Closterium sp. NIES-68]|nr:hypothetical protein CLOM_g12646 [Closterium sp. NIES-68]GJP82742.1 hypothetical protein CLOP_g12984 [Closterium sp. NIES-67]
MADSSPGIVVSGLLAIALSVLLFSVLTHPVNAADHTAKAHVIKDHSATSQITTVPSDLDSSHSRPVARSIRTKRLRAVAAREKAWRNRVPGSASDSTQIRESAWRKRVLTSEREPPLGSLRHAWQRVLTSAQRKASNPFKLKQPELKIETVDWSVKHARLGGDPLNGFDVFVTGVLTFNALIYNPNPYGLKINAIYVHAEYNGTFLGNSKLPPMNVFALKSSPVKAPFNLENLPVKKGWRIYRNGDVLAAKVDIQGFGRVTSFGIKSPVMQILTTCNIMYVLKGGKILSQKCSNPDYGLG